MPARRRRTPLRPLPAPTQFSDVSGPTVAAAAVKELLEKDPPYGAKVSFSDIGANAGWDAPEMSPWLEKSLQEGSQKYFGKPAMFMGEGGTIPFMRRYSIIWP